MKLALYGILVIIALFIILMVFNPRLSCFGRKLKSPFYPVTRKRKMKNIMRETTDYGFDLGGSGEKRTPGGSSHIQAQKRRPGSKPNILTEDYGFDLGGRNREKKQAE
jgi:hypothetical protein